MTRTQTKAVHDAVIARYVADVREAADNGWVDVGYVLEAITHDPTDVIYELLDLTWKMDLRGGCESAADQDAWWDAVEAMLPTVAKALRT